MVLEFEVEALIQQKKLGSALILIAQRLEKIEPCRIATSLNKMEKTIDTLHERVDSLTENSTALENKFDELLK